MFCVIAPFGIWSKAVEVMCRSVYTTLNGLCWQRIAIVKIIILQEFTFNIYRWCQQFRVIIVVYWSQLPLLLIMLTHSIDDDDKE